MMSRSGGKKLTDYKCGVNQTFIPVWIMASNEKEVFYFEAESRTGVLVFDLSKIREELKALDRGKWFVQLEYVYFDNQDGRAWTSHIQSPEVVDSKREKALLGIVNKIQGVRRYIFAPGDLTSRRIVQPMTNTKTSLTLELRVGHGGQGYAIGQIQDGYVKIGLSIHIPHAQPRPR
jgi:hypothetical protein